MFMLEHCLQNCQTFLPVVSDDWSAERQGCVDTVQAQGHKQTTALITTADDD